MRITRKCSECKQDFRKEELIEYTTVSGKTSKWYCRNCYEDKLSRERFQNKVCQIFGLKSPGPLIWTQRKRLRDTYGYTDDTIVDCLEYIYHVEKKKILKDSLGLVQPYMVERMRKWKAEKKAIAGSLAAAMANTQMNEHLTQTRENTTKKKEINLDDALLD